MAANDELQAMLDSKLSNLKENYLDVDDITGSTWGGLRSDLMAKWRRLPGRSDLDLPLLNIQEDFNPIVTHKVPKTCSPLDGSSGKDWPIETINITGSQRKDLATPEEFKQQLDLATHGFLKYVPWQETKSCIAGGLIEACMRSPAGSSPEANVREGPRGEGDIDIFFYGQKTYEDLIKSSTTVALSIIKAIKEAGIEKIKMERRTSSFTLLVDEEGEFWESPQKKKEGEPVYRPIQLVLMIDLPRSISHVLHKFDVDCCGHAYDGEKVLSTWKALRAWAFQANVADIEFLMASRRGGRLISGGLNCETRLLKYGLRGYAIAVPGLTATALAAAQTKADKRMTDTSISVDGLPLLLYRHKAKRYPAPRDDSPFVEDQVTKENIGDEAKLREMVNECVEPEPNELPEEPVWEPVPGETALVFQKSWINGDMDKHRLKFDFW